MLGPMLRVLVVSLVLLVAAMVALSGSRGRRLPEPEVATVFAQSLPLPEFHLVDQTNRPFDSTERLRGDFSLMFFGFTNCPDICPITLQVLAAARSQLMERGLATPQVVFVSVDPKRDNPEQISAYLGNFDPAFVGLTGEPEALDPLLDTLGLTTHIQQHPGQASYTVIHNPNVFVIGPQGELIAVFSGPHDPNAIAEDYLRIRSRYLRSPPTPVTS